MIWLDVMSCDDHCDHNCCVSVFTFYHQPREQEQGYAHSQPAAWLLAPGLESAVPHHHQESESDQTFTVTKSQHKYEGWYIPNS